jgi:hypothetical protein
LWAVDEIADCINNAHGVQPSPIYATTKEIADLCNCAGYFIKEAADVHSERILSWTGISLCCNTASSACWGNSRRPKCTQVIPNEIEGESGAFGVLLVLFLTLPVCLIRSKMIMAQVEPKNFSHKYLSTSRKSLLVLFSTTVTEFVPETHFTESM